MSAASGLTAERAQSLFDALAAREDEIAFRWLVQGCECRAQLMIEWLLSQGVPCGRVWALSVGRLLAVPNPASPRQSYKWRNHVAPSVPVPGAPHELLLLDPSLSRTGPLDLVTWAAIMKAVDIEIVTTGLSQEEILKRQTERALRGLGLDAVLFCLALGQPPILELGGSGYRIGADPDEGPTVHAREMTKVYLARQGGLPPTRP
jgi:hypothetical protein